MLSSYQGYLKRRILIPLTGVIVFTIVLFNVIVLWQVSKSIDHEAGGQISYAELSYRHSIEAEATRISGLVELLTTDTKLRSAFINRDRTELLALGSTYYAYLNQSQQITHFYFTLPDRTNLMRIHEPSRYGDRIERETTLRAEQSGKLAYGLELGPLGTFTLRVVKPWFHEGKLIGYLELGEEIDHIIDSLRHTLGMDIFILINKKHIDRQKWESGMRMLGREPDWEQYPDHILVSKPINRDTIPASLELHLDNNQELVMDRLIDVTIPQHNLKASFTPLTDVSGNRVGMMLLLTSTDFWISDGQKTFWGAALLIMVLGSGVFLLFYRLSDNTERVLETSRQRLFEESERNYTLQASHIAELQEHNLQLEQATAAVNKSHTLLMEAEKMAHIGSWEWDITSGNLNWSDEVFRIFGLDPLQTRPTYQIFLSVIPAESRERVETAVKNAIDEGRMYDVEHRIIRPDGSERIVREMGRAFYNPDNQPVRMVGTVHDITYQRLTEQSVRHLGQILDNSSNEIYLINSKTLLIEQANQTALRHLGYSAEEITSHSYTDIVGDFDHERFMLMLEPLTNGTRKELEAESWHQKKDGQRYPVEVRLQLSNTNGDPLIVAIVLDTSERQQQQEALYHQSLHDMLTGLPNRELLNEQLVREIAIAKRTSTPLTLVQLDLINFREVNDTLGHINGDLLLRQVAERLCTAVRESDTVARIAGDEFYLLLPDSGREQCHNLIQQLQQTLGAPFKVGTYTLNIEANGGIAVFPEHAADAAQLLRQADVALTRAKAQRSGYEIYNAESDPFSVRRLLLNSHMRHAIERNEFMLYYQPKVTSASRRIEEAEALIRWRHPEHGFISPGEFIPLAEETGYIKHITLWVIEEAARQLAQWQKLGKELVISVNLSARNLQDPALISYVVETVARHGIKPTSLAFEITETTVMHDPDFTLGVLNELNAMGHPIAIDDYGTGYSSLTYLRRLPANELKIDLSFIRSMLDDEDSAIIVCSTIEMAHHLGLRVTAEGVENADLAEILTIIDADLLQGYHFSKPLPSEEFLALLTPQ